MGKGADTGMFDNSRDNALSEAVYNNYYFAIELLLSKQQDHTRPIKYHGILIHKAASGADAKTLRLLARGNLSRRDISVKDLAGLIARDVSQQRDGIDAEWLEAFSCFLNSVDQDLEHTAGDSHHPGGTWEDGENDDDWKSDGNDSNDDGSDSTGEMFEDAVEVQI